MKKIHMIAGLPRSGSTVLSSILNQNPRFSSGIANPLNDLINGASLAFSVAGTRTQTNHQQRINVMRHIIGGYYEENPAEVVFNSSRTWTSFLHLMHLVTPEAKVICCVRDIFWILDSFEVLVSKDPTIHFYESEITNLNNVYTRTEAQFTRGPLKIALDSLKQGYYSEHNNKLLIVEYDELTKNPEQTIRSVYSFIGEEYFNHDYDNIEAQYDEYDLSMGQLGMHKVRKKVENIQRLATLPPDLYEKYSNKGYEFWR